MATQQTRQTTRGKKSPSSAGGEVVDAAGALARRWVASLTGRSTKQPAIRVECRKQGWGGLQMGRGLDACFLKLGGKQYGHGLGSHADSCVVLRCAQAMQRLHAVVGVDDNSVTHSAGGDKLRIVFRVEVAGKELWRSGELNLKSGGAPVDVALPARTHELVLRADAIDGNLAAAHIDWADLGVTIAGRSVAVGTPGIANLAPPLPGPFSFVYGGQPSCELLCRWARRTGLSKRGKGFSVHQIIWRDPAGGLECRLALKAFTSYPAMEWVVYFKNTGNQDSQILEQLQALDLAWPAGQPVGRTWAPARLWRSRGSQCLVRDFEYLEEELPFGSRLAMAAGGGRSSQEWLPFFNLQTAGLGILTAIGWSGQWACTLESDHAGGLRVRAGLEKTHLRLHPGEEIRGPRILQLFWTGDRTDAHNRWRRLLMDHYVPRVKGKPVTPPLTIAHWGGMSTRGHLERIASYKKHRLPHEVYWIDADWFGLGGTCSGDERVSDWYRRVGDWRVNPKAHPKGLGPISAAVRDAGMKLLLWVEPERAAAGTQWPNQHPDWFLSAPGCGGNLLLDLGNPSARRGAVNLIAGLIRDNHLGMYRQDSNLDTLPYWRHNDPKDRQGMTEIRHVTGLYAFWDALLKKFPALVIDNCCSGGRRIDLETISRSIPLWRSDWQCLPDNDPIGGQTHGMGLCYWVPLHGTGTYNSMATSDRCATYRARSAMGPAWQLSAFPYETHPVEPDYPWDRLRRMAGDYLRARAAFTGDYYPLTDATADAGHWAAYQMHHAGLDEGFVMAFSRKAVPWTTVQFKLRGLQAGAVYAVEDADTGRTRRIKGKFLLDQGLPVRLAHPESSALVFYHNVQGAK
jgi:alpha-galactosidase